MQIREVFDRKRFVFLDGGMGTQLQARGLQPGQKPELAALEMPDVLTAIHTDYANAGADILLANTFGANAKNWQAAAIRWRMSSRHPSPAPARPPILPAHWWRWTSAP